MFLSCFVLYLLFYVSTIFTITISQNAGIIDYVSSRKFQYLHFRKCKRKFGCMIQKLVNLFLFINAYILNLCTLSNVKFTINSEQLHIANRVLLITYCSQPKYTP